MRDSKFVWSNLTREQFDALEAIQMYWNEHETGPTLRELAPRLGITAASAVRYRLMQLEQRELIQIEHSPARRIARTLRLTAAGSLAVLRFKKLRRSSLLRGERELFLNAPALAAARRAGVPLHAYAGHKLGDGFSVLFIDRAERDFWAGLVLDELDGVVTKDPAQAVLFQKRNAEREQR